MQDKFPKLLVDQIIMIPHLGYIKKPKKGNAIFLGWLDGIKYSELFFKQMISKYRVIKLKEKYESLGFKVMAGVLNREDGIKYFQKAGIHDIFTDEVELAKICHKHK